jgi:hypothetical protein
MADPTSPSEPDSSGRSSTREEATSSNISREGDDILVPITHLPPQPLVQDATRTNRGDEISSSVEPSDQLSLLPQSHISTTSSVEPSADLARERAEADPAPREDPIQSDGDRDVSQGIEINARHSVSSSRNTRQDR